MSTPAFFASEQNIHINLIWKTKFSVLSKLKPNERPHLIPSDTQKFPIVSQLIQWKQLNPRACVSLWVDYQENPDAALNLITLLKAHSIEVKDTNTLTTLKFNVEFDSHGQPICTKENTEEGIPFLEYFETDDWTVIDLMKISVLIHDFKRSHSTFSVFSDIDVKAFKVSQKALLQDSPFVFLKWCDKGHTIVSNNGFLAFLNTGTNLKLLEKWLEAAIDDAFIEGKNAFFSLKQVFAPYELDGKLPVTEVEFMTDSRQHDVNPNAAPPKPP